jgi:NAD(P)-dependent dehydrogenase (short-subunit alcohol dehydrogenase family)
VDTLGARLDMTGRVALVTGGTSGIGRAAAQGFLGQGATVVVCGRDPERGATVVTELDSDRVSFVAADVTDEEQVAGLVATVVDRHGRLDYAFNNAANAEALTSSGAFTDMSLDEYSGVLRTLMTSGWLSMRHEIPAMLASGGGAIVNTSSMDAALPAEEPAATRRASSDWRVSRSPWPRSSPPAGSVSTPSAPVRSSPPCWSATSPPAVPRRGTRTSPATSR